MSSAIVINCSALSRFFSKYSSPFCLLMTTSPLVWLYLFLELKDLFGIILLQLQAHFFWPSQTQLSPSSHDIPRNKSTICKEHHLCLANPRTLCWALPSNQPFLGLACERLPGGWLRSFLAASSAPANCAWLCPALFPIPIFVYKFPFLELLLIAPVFT